MNPFEELAKNLNNLTENTPVSELVDYFDFENGFDIVEAMQYYEERELYNTCKALNIYFSKYINKIINNII